MQQLRLAAKYNIRRVAGSTMHPDYANVILVTITLAAFASYRRKSCD